MNFQDPYSKEPTKPAKSLEKNHKIIIPYIITQQENFFICKKWSLKKTLKYLKEKLQLIHVR